MRHLTKISYLAFLFGVACNPDWKLDVEIEVPSEVQQQFAGQYPAELLVSGEKIRFQGNDSVAGDFLPMRVAVLCEPSDETKMFRTQVDAIGCSTETRVRAWLEPNANIPLALRMCGQDDTGVSYDAAESDEAAPLEEDPARAEAIAFQGELGSECDGSAHGAVRLQLSRTP